MEIKDIVEIAGVVIAGLAVILTCLEHKRSRYNTVNEYLKAFEDNVFVEARRKIYQLDENNEPISRGNKEAAIIINFFHRWGLLAKKKYLPMWVFNSGSGTGLIRYYEITKDCIDQTREHFNDELYASNFEWLYKKIKRRLAFKCKLQCFKNKIINLFNH